MVVYSNSDSEPCQPMRQALAFAPAWHRAERAWVGGVGCPGDWDRGIHGPVGLAKRISPESSCGRIASRSAAASASRDSCAWMRSMSATCRIHTE